MTAVTSLGIEEMSIVPAWWRTFAWTMLRPRPEPGRVSVVGVKMRSGRGGEVG